MLNVVHQFQCFRTMSDELLDALRNILLFLWMFSFLPGISSSVQNLGVDKLEMEIRAFRLQQFETSGKPYGSKSWKVLYEAVSFKESALRKCMIVYWKDLIGADLDAKFSAPVGSVLVVIPDDFDRLSETEKQEFILVEQEFADLRTDMAVYFAPDSSQLQILLKNVALSASGKAPSAMQQMINSMVADNYQISSANTATTNVASTKVYNVIAHLNAAERGRPYLFIVAHYDTFGIIPALNVGADSNGSGVAVLLELLAIFSQLYFLPSHRARYNLVFVLSAGGKFSYQGSRSFIDDFNERHSDETISLAVCLDGLAQGRGALNVHASKVPSEGNAQRFIQTLKNFAPNGLPIDLVTKKINLAAERLSWEHEIYNIRRIHALTLSHFSNHTDPIRNSLVDVPKVADMAALERNTRLISNALIAFVFGLDSLLCQSAKESDVECSILNEAIGVDRKRLHAWMQIFGSNPRPVMISQQRLVTNLHEVVKRFAHNSHIAEVAVNDFVLYDVLEDTLTVNIVKPAIFELILASFVCAYLYVVYHIAMHAQSILENSAMRFRKLLQ